MKKFFVIICASLLLLTGCSNTKKICTQPNSFFSENEERFILVDMGTVKTDVQERPMFVYADAVTGVMYICNFNLGWCSPLYNSDGSLMIYDPLN